MLEINTWPSNTWSVFDELEAIQESLNRTIGARDYSYPQQRMWPNRYPPINVWTSDEGLVVDAELPGINPEDVDISVMEDQLTLKGKMNPVPEKDGHKLHSQERPFGNFSRSLMLPFRVNHDGVTAHFKNGILRLTLPRSEAEKPRKIEVKSA